LLIFFLSNPLGKINEGICPHHPYRMMVFGEYLKKPKGTRQKAKKRLKALISEV